MRKKLIYVFLVSLLVAGSSAFAMVEKEGISGRVFNISKSTALRLLNTDKTLEVGEHHYEVTGTVSGTAGKMFTETPDKMLSFYGFSFRDFPKNEIAKEWQYLDFAAIDGRDGDASLFITQIDED